MKTQTENHSEEHAQAYPLTNKLLTECLSDPCATDKQKEEAEKMLRVMNYQAKRNARIERLRERADKKVDESNSAYARFRSIGDRIPMGQPILVGHHSEKMHRTAIKRMDNAMRKSSQCADEAKRLESRAAAMENNRAIFSEDPEAVEKIEAKIERLEKQQVMMVAANKCVRKGDREGLADLGFGPTLIEKLFTPDCFNNLGFAGYMLTNNSANIRRLKLRIGQVAAQQAVQSGEETVGLVRIERDGEANRVRLFFPERLSPELYKLVRGHGFLWARSLSCFQRQLGAGWEWKTKACVDAFNATEAAGVAA